MGKTNKETDSANYSATIVNASMELTARDKIKFSDVGDAKHLDKETADGELIITPVDFVTLQVHNDKAKGDHDYQQYLILDADGTKYVTGSDSFFASFMDIFKELHGVPEEKGWQLKVYQRESKNYSGKNFITCSLV